jgi:mannose-6-phosphate isomerase-like protein (cupin superfamily)
MDSPWETRVVPEAYDTLAPDGSEIRLLVRVRQGSMVHCSLPAGSVTRAVRHRSVEEVWYFLGGQGQLWRKAGEVEQIVDVRPGMAVSIPAGAHFQFRSAGPEPLTFVITTMPPWPGEDEAVMVPGVWPTR